MNSPTWWSNTKMVVFLPLGLVLALLAGTFLILAQGTGISASFFGRLCKSLSMWVQK